MGCRGRWRNGGHRVPEYVESNSPEPAERESPDARYAGLFQYGRPEFGFDAHARRKRHERFRNRHAGKERREENAGRNISGGSRSAVHSPEAYRKSTETLQAESA